MPPSGRAYTLHRSIGDWSELAAFDATSWGKRPVKVTLDEPSLVEPGLLLFAAFIVREPGEDANAAATVVITAG